MLSAPELFPAIVAATLVVAMTTLLFCCWKRKEVKETPGEKLTPVQGGHNGEVKEEEQENSSNDHDFSAVQRETEILRPYRKPPPPKNRGRQSRAGRAMTRSTEHLDVFGEIQEEEEPSSRTDSATSTSITGSKPSVQIVLSDLTTGDNTSNGVPDQDQAEGMVMLRDKEGKEETRDARSSMLADIEQTLANMHRQSDQDKLTDETEEAEGEDKSTDKTKVTKPKSDDKPSAPATPEGFPDNSDSSSQEKPSSDSVDKEVKPSPDSVDKEVKPSPDSVDKEVKPSPDSVDKEVKPSPDSVDKEVKPSPDSVDKEVKPSSDSVDKEVRPSSDSVDKEVKPSVESADNSEEVATQSSEVVTVVESEPQAVVDRDNKAEASGNPTNDKEPKESPNTEVADSPKSPSLSARTPKIGPKVSPKPQRAALAKAGIPVATKSKDGPKVHSAVSKDGPKVHSAASKDQASQQEVERKAHTVATQQSAIPLLERKSSSSESAAPTVCKPQCETTFEIPTVKDSEQKDICGEDKPSTSQAMSESESSAGRDNSKGKPETTLPESEDRASTSPNTSTETSTSPSTDTQDTDTQTTSKDKDESLSGQNQSESQDTPDHPKKANPIKEEQDNTSSASPPQPSQIDSSPADQDSRAEPPQSEASSVAEPNTGSTEAPSKPPCSPSSPLNADSPGSQPQSPGSPPQSPGGPMSSRRESEDGEGKGKAGSRIPIRAGSKPRSSPPKSPSGENTD